MAKQGKIFISKPWGGWISTLGVVNSAVGPLASLEGGDNQYTYSIAVSLSRVERPGHLGAGEVFTAIADPNSYVVGVGMPINASVSSTGYSFVVLQGGYVVRMANATNYPTMTFTGYTIPVAHGGNTIVKNSNTDSIILKDRAATPNEYVIATWEDSGTTADAMIFIPTDTGATTVQDSDWFSGGNSANYLTAIASPARIPHKIVQGPDGNVYITNGQYIASATMTAGQSLGAATRNTQALNLGSGWTASGITGFKNFIAIIGYRSTTFLTSLARGECRVWLWDGFSPEPNLIYGIPDNFANGIFSDGTDLFAFTGGRNSSSKIFQFDGTNFVQVFESGYIETSDAQIHGGIEAYQNSIHFAYFTNTNGHLGQFFRKAFHDRTVFLDGSTKVTAVGMLKNLFQSGLFVGVGEGTITSGVPATNKILLWSGSSASYINASWRSRLFQVPPESTNHKIKFNFSQFGSGASLRVSMFKGYDTCSPGSSTDLLNKTLTQGLLGTLKTWSIPVTLTGINSFYLDLLWNHTSTSDVAAIIQDIAITYELTDSPA